MRGDQLVGEDHQLLDQPVSLRLRNGTSGGDVALGVECEFRLGGDDLQRARPLAASGTGNLASDLERPGNLGRGRLAAGEDPVKLVIVQAGVGEDARAREREVPDPRVGIEADLGCHRQTLDSRREAAGLVAEDGGSMGSTVPGT